MEVARTSTIAQKFQLLMFLKARYLKAPLGGGIPYQLAATRFLAVLVMLAASSQALWSATVQRLNLLHLERMALVVRHAHWRNEI